MTTQGSSAEHRWERIARALHRDANGTLRTPSRGALAPYVAAVLFFVPLGGWTVKLGVERLTMSRSWIRGTAEVLAVPGPRAPTPRRHYDLVLRRVLSDGTAVDARAILGHPFRVGWSRPGRVPQPGDRLDIVIDPDDPRRMTTVDSLGDLPGGGIVFGAGILAIATFPLAGLVTAVWLRRRGLGDMTSKHP
ncbi:hypothetical protein J5Y09_05135 [Roseomonas sp. PWR1]|uniref:DUF3592 domain-containing protein n=1 Tax=Roseomonas nitratireducens TaxID=2820810 RepID=A0ABS4AR30_9PROT|nr:hypothetical protein [Neoroseomonas nitratireducens]MBP0463286.1 hypothetical protein [Neoroseomonas nitratireducens]